MIDRLMRFHIDSGLINIIISTVVEVVVVVLVDVLVR